MHKAKIQYKKIIGQMIGENVLAINMLILKARFKLKKHTKVACQHIQFSAF